VRALIVVAVLSFARPAHAECEKIFCVPKRFVLGGLNIGSSVGHGDDGLVLGAEISAGGLEDSGDFPSWYGGYLDVVHDFATEQTRISIGPEFGIAFVGLDGGIVFQNVDDETKTGVAGRLALTIGFISIYGRAIAVDGARFGEVGVLLKGPLSLKE
jgi:hypothetical protein